MGCFSTLLVCLIFALVMIRGGKAGLLDVCENDAACKVESTGDPHAVCSKEAATGGDANGKCICTGAFKNNGNNDGCVAKGNGDVCSTDKDCAAVIHSTCESDKRCGCADGYKISSTTCSAVLGTACAADTAAADCTNHVENAACTDKVCSCAAGYRKAGAICSTESSADSVRLAGSIIVFSVFTAVVAHVI